MPLLIVPPRTKIPEKNHCSFIVHLGEVSIFCVSSYFKFKIKNHFNFGHWIKIRQFKEMNIYSYSLL